MNSLLTKLFFTSFVLIASAFAQSSDNKFELNKLAIKTFTCKVKCSVFCDSEQREYKENFSVTKTSLNNLKSTLQDAINICNDDMIKYAYVTNRCEGNIKYMHTDNNEKSIALNCEEKVVYKTKEEWKN